MTNYGAVKQSLRSYVPGAPGVASFPGQPYLPERVVTTTTPTTVYVGTPTVKMVYLAELNGTPPNPAWTPVYSYPPTGIYYDPPIYRTLIGYLVPIPSTGGWVTEYVTTFVTLPEQPYIPPTYPVEAIPGYTEQLNNLGWNASGHSIAFLVAQGYAEFRPPESSVDVFVGLATADAYQQYTSLRAAFRISHNKITLFADGVGLTPVLPPQSVFSKTAGAVSARVFDAGFAEFVNYRVTNLRLELHDTTVSYMVTTESWRAGAPTPVATTEVIYTVQIRGGEELHLTVFTYSSGDFIDNARLGYLASGGNGVLRPIDGYGVGDPTREFYEGASLVMESLRGQGGISATMVGQGAHGILEYIVGLGWTSTVRGYSSSVTTLEPLKMDSYVPSYSAGVLPLLTSLGADRVYGAAAGTLEPLTLNAYSGLVRTEYAIGDGAIGFLYLAATGLSGGVGNSTLNLQPLDGLGSGTLYQPVAFSEGVLPFLQGAGGISATMVGQGSALVLEPLRGDAAFAYGGRIYGESEGVLPYMTSFGSAYEGNNLFKYRETIAGVDSWFAIGRHYGEIEATVGVSDTFLFNMIISGHLPCEVQAATSINGVPQCVALMFTSVQANFGVPASFGPADTWVLNMATKATSRYEGYNFNSYGVLDGVSYGCAAEGLYRLTGDDDAGAPIAAALDFGVNDFGTSRRKSVTAAYVGLTSTGKLMLKVSYEGNEYLYAARGYAEELKTQRFDTGRGIRANYLRFELYNRDGDDFDIDSVEFLIVPLSRRI